MKKIVVELNQKSIQQNIDYLKHLRRNIKRMMNELLEFACEWIIDRANWYIEQSDLGDLVKMDIRNSWSYSIANSSAKIENNADKAVFVEFGVGVVGEGTPHPNSQTEGYEYNVQRNYTDDRGVSHSTKDENGMWYFWTNSNELDLPLNSITDIRGFDDFRGKNREQGKRIVVGTQGAEGVWFAYNAIVAANVDLQNPNGDFAKEWRKIKERYIV